MTTESHGRNNIAWLKIRLAHRRQMYKDSRTIWRRLSITFASAHRSPKFVEGIIHDAEADGCSVFIAMAGLAAALPGAVAALTTKPVIGVPCGGRVPYDSLLSIVQLPPGVPAATVGVDRGDNAGYLAVQMLALKNDDFAQKLKQNKLDQIERVKQMDREVNGGA